MGRKCTVCVRADREAIDKALLEYGTSVRAMAATTGLSVSALNRHRLDHVPQLMSKAIQERSAQGRPELFDREAPPVPAAIKEHEVIEQSAAQALVDQAADQQNKEVALGAQLLDKAIGLEHQVMEILTEARNAKVLKTAIMAIGKAAEILKLQGELIGKIKEGAVVSNNLIFISRKESEEEWAKQQ